MGPKSHTIIIVPTTRSENLLTDTAASHPRTRGVTYVLVVSSYCSWCRPCTRGVILLLVVSPMYSWCHPITRGVIHVLVLGRLFRGIGPLPSTIPSSNFIKIAAMRVK
ncbi:hypothetical protein AVEN_222789-1 [Araneus ventricosus]|uniref:Uncharacterized protein n=1 Tax=Araneus ventricosus TaxID=182803 RepID=A0A4Y2B1X1_ARAVE|nr:hypothetical protein AVEN_222789-1 [Araneus ventricosus]